ncbi:MAG: threonylcarbamoyl-AMP synthase [Clostridia bacterium]|nr:threonylcarbamoyl-AMP synthase [Clostridia bacterium]
METKILLPTEENIRLAAEAVASGTPCAFPTETVYGLGANALMRDAAERVFQAKGRPSDNPLIVHFGSVEDIPLAAQTVTPVAEKLIAAFMPGPITVVLPKRECISSSVTAGLDTVGIRVPVHPVAQSFLRACGVPVAAPSANTSTRPSPTTAMHVYEDLQGKIPYILDGGACRVGIESTVVLATGEIPVVLRPGRVTGEDIAKVCGDVAFSKGITDTVRSPGVKYKHYAPKVPVTLFQKQSLDKVRTYAQGRSGLIILCLKDTAPLLSGLSVRILGNSEQELAAKLFAALRDAEKEFDEILLEAPEGVGFGVSLLDRMQKAAGGNHI